jgi:uncharacterized protein (DUF433 family)
MAHERIEINPDIMGGKPVLRGTRIPVETVLRKLGAGMTVEAIMSDHPRITQADILAAQRVGWLTHPVLDPLQLPGPKSRV